MKRRIKKSTKAEEAYIRDVKRTGPFAKLDKGEAKLLSPQDYPEPVKRFLSRERNTLRIRLSSSTKRKLDALSRARGTRTDQLARTWVEERLTREAG